MYTIGDTEHITKSLILQAMQENTIVADYTRQTSTYESQLRRVVTRILWGGGGEVVDKAVLPGGKQSHKQSTSLTARIPTAQEPNCSAN